MKFGVREICDVVFKAKSDVQIGRTTFKKGQPVLYIDTAKTSTLEGSATTVYATGGKGNTNLIAWEGEKALTFTVEDALLSPMGFAILSGAGLFDGNEADTQDVHVHQTYTTTISKEDSKFEIELKDALGKDVLCGDAPIFVVVADAEDGSITGKMLDGFKVDGTKLVADTLDGAKEGTTVFVDYYVTRKGSTVSELQIEAGTFAGAYYVEASTLFRRQGDSTDMPAEITIPNAKIQSNFSFSMASTGDPSTFTFTMDALPGYTVFDNTKKVLCVIQIVDDHKLNDSVYKTVMPCPTDTDNEVSAADSASKN